MFQKIFKYLINGNGFCAQKPNAIAVSDVKEYYETWHERYLTSFGDYFQSARMNTIEELASHYLKKVNLKKGSRLLDAGCGVGGPAIHMSKFGDLIVEGITISDKQCQTAREKIKNEGLQEKVRVIQGDFHNLENIYSLNSFDGVIFLEALVHSDNPNLVLSQAYKVLKPKGVLYIKDLFAKTDFTKNDKNRVLQAQQNTNKFCALNVRPSKEVICIAKEIGFDLIEYNNLAETMNHDIGNAFVINNHVDIYGENEPIEYLEWAELKFIKSE